MARKVPSHPRGAILHWWSRYLIVIDLWDFVAVRGCVTQEKNTYIAKVSKGSAVDDEAEFMRKSGRSGKKVNTWISAAASLKLITLQRC